MFIFNAVSPDLFDLILMVAKYALILSIFLCLEPCSSQIITFDFSSLTGSESTATSNFNNLNLSNSTISRGSGLSASNNAGRFNAIEWTSSGSIDLTDYMEFTITPINGYEFSVSSMTFQLRRSDTGPRAIALRSSLDGYVSNLDTSFIITDNTNTQNFTFTFSQPSSSSAVSYRVYMYTAESPVGSAGIGDGAGDDIIVYGEVSAPSNCTPIFEDDFDSGLGAWSNTDDWTTSQDALKHNLSATAGTSYIYSDIGAQNLNAANYEWQFCMRNGNWDPSSTNNFTFYLLSNDPDLQSRASGYAVGVNRLGATDLLTFYEVNSGAHSSLIISPFDWNNEDEVCVRVTRNTSGLWTFYYDANGFGEVNVGSITDNTFSTGNFIGTYFEFTQSRAGEFWVDYVVVCTEVVVSGPELQIASLGNNENCGYTLDFGIVESSEATLDVHFEIENLGNADLEISALTISGIDATDFYLVNPTAPPATIIAPGRSQEVTIRFIPSSTGAKSAVLSIANNDTDENPCQVLLIGEGVINLGNGPLMITQYYEGSGTNKWIEITNITNGIVSANNYFLGTYNQYGSCYKEPLNGSPTSSMRLPNVNLDPGDIILLKEPTTVIPNYANATTNMFPASFNGDDIIVLSTDNGENCFKNRIDIIGEYSSPCGSSSWGKEKSFVRNQCVSEGTDITFKQSHWTVYNYNDPVIATTTGDGTNPYLGQHRFIVIYNGATWVNGVPNFDVSVLFNNGIYNTIDGDIECCSLVVSGGASLNVNDNSYVKITKDVLNNGNITVQTYGAIVQEGNGMDAGTFTNNGNASVIKQTSDFFDDGFNYHYTYWSSPVKNADIISVFPNPKGDRRFYFDTSQYIDTNNDDISDTPNDWQQATGTMEAGRGYAVTATIPPGFPYNNIHQFSGTFNTGDISKTIVMNNYVGDNDWNFIGNPYPSAIDFIDLYNQNSTLIAGAAFLWSQSLPPNGVNPGNEVLNFNTADYATYTVGSGGVAGSNGIIPTQFIPSGQGFFVKGISSGVLTFNNSMRMANTSSNGVFYSFNSTNESDTVSSNRLWLNLTSDNGVFSQTLVAYVDGATNERDNWNYDAPRNMSTGTYANLYSQIDYEEDKFVIQGKAPETLNAEETIRIGFNTSIEVPTLYTISIAQIEGNFFEDNSIFIKDNLDNVLQNLNLSEYTFTSEIGEFNERFEIVFKDEVDTPVVTDSDVLQIIELDNGDVKFKLGGTNRMISIEIIDLLGRKLYRLNPEDSIEKTFRMNNLSQAIYIAMVTLSNGHVITKKAIKKK